MVLILFLPFIYEVMVCLENLVEFYKEEKRSWLKRQEHDAVREAKKNAEARAAPRARCRPQVSIYMPERVLLPDNSNDDADGCGDTQRMAARYPGAIFRNSSRP